MDGVEATLLRPIDDNDAPVRPCSRPQVLVIAGQLPFPADDPQRAHAWNQLRLLAEHCRVHLACLLDRPLHLEWWNAVQALVDDLAVEPTGLLTRWVGPVPSLALRRVIVQWSNEIAFDAVVAMHASTAVYARALPAPIKVLDAGPRVEPHRATIFRRLRRRFHERRLARIEQMALGQFDYVLSAVDGRGELESIINGVLVRPDVASLAPPTPTPSPTLLAA